MDINSSNSIVKTKENLKKGLSPIITTNSKILILGSLPSDKSISKNEYYGNPSNHFWNILSMIYTNENIKFINYQEKLDFLNNYNIALWDVYSSSERKGSMDSNILNPNFNNIMELLKNYPNITKILTNGKKSEEAFLEYITLNNIDLNTINITHFTLPSSSAANTRFKLINKIDIWKKYLLE